MDRKESASVLDPHCQFMKRSRLSRVWLLIVPLAFLGATPGPSRVEKTVDTTADPLISLSNLKGHVTVKGWEKSQVHLVSVSASPRIEVDVEQFPPSGRAAKMHFATHILDPQLGDKSTDYSLDVPLGSSLQIRNPEGSVQIQTLQGEASLDSVGGTISVSDVAGHLAIRSIGGDIEMVRHSGRVEADSVNGSVRIVSASSSRLRVSTTSGKIFYEGDFLPGGVYELKDYNGDMEILAPASASFEVNASTVRGKVIADPDISFKPKRHPAFRPPGSSSLFGTHNTGSANLDLTSFSGTIRIRRLP